MHSLRFWSLTADKNYNKEATVTSDSLMPPHMSQSVRSSPLGFLNMDVSHHVSTPY